MKLYEHFGRSGFHTTILSSFGVDFDAYENVVLARLRGAGCHNNLLILDERMLSLALDGASQPPRFAGRLYSVAGAQARGVFHPKVVLQLGQASGRLIVSSANVTSSGLAGNLEIAGVLSGGSESAGEARLIAAAWAFSSRFLPRQEDGIRQQVEWMLARTPWLRHTEPADGIVALADGSAAAFLASGESTGIAERFLAAIGGESIERLVIVSPYWDDELRALGFLLERTQAVRTAILIDPLRHQFPAGGLQGNRRPELVAFGARDEKRFVHAKLVIAQTGSADHVLFGSANCTPAALGIEGFAGSNEEACLYRSLPPGAAVETLKLTETLGSAALDPERLPQVGGPEPIPLQDLARRNPGRFECRFDTLSWWPPPAVDPEKVRLELLAADRQPQEIELQPVSRRSDGAVRYRMVGAAGRPALVDALDQDATWPIAPGEAVSLAIRNALFTITPVNGLFLFARLREDAETVEDEEDVVHSHSLEGDTSRRKTRPPPPRTEPHSRREAGDLDPVRAGLSSETENFEFRLLRCDERLQPGIRQQRVRRVGEETDEEGRRFPTPHGGCIMPIAISTRPTMTPSFAGLGARAP